MTKKAFDPYFISLTETTQGIHLPTVFTMMRNNTPHPLCAVAATHLQQYLHRQSDWDHNFGLTEHATKPVIGKMFGVLVVQTPQQEIGYLAAFSGKLAGSNQHTRFVPAIFDALAGDGFLTEGMQELARINDELKSIQAKKSTEHETPIKQLKAIRKNHSVALQQKLFEHYYFLNTSGERKSVFEIFNKASYKNPPSGAGECATPKLLQYAFQHQLKPIAIAEFWWGQSPKSTHWKHGHFYPCCKEKCEPILAHMLKGTDYELT